MAPVTTPVNAATAEDSYPRRSLDKNDRGSFTSLFSSSLPSSPSLTANQSRTLASGLMSAKDKEEAEATAKAKARTWAPEIPRWYRPFDHNVSAALDHEEILRKEILSPPPRPARTPIIRQASKKMTGKGNSSLSNDTQCGDALLASGVERRYADGENKQRGGIETVTGMGAEGTAREQEAGSFVVRATGVSGVLQLLFVAKTEVGSKGITWSRAWCSRYKLPAPSFKSAHR